MTGALHLLVQVPVPIHPILPTLSAIFDSSFNAIVGVTTLPETGTSSSHL
jgi:hypothetical protein